MEIKEENKRKKIEVIEHEKVELSNKESFKVGCYKNNYFVRPGHFHKEYELTLITKGFGTRMVGDNFEKFEEGDLVLIGGNLPHAWFSDSSFYKENNENFCESIYVQFKKSVFGTQFINIPELQSIRTVLEKSKLGIKISGKGKEKIIENIKSLPHERPIEQLLILIRILDLIQFSDFSTLVSEDFITKTRFKSDKMNKVHKFIMQNFKNEIDINACAEEISMTPTSFCRFLKKQTSVTFSVYINYIRIDFAQKMLSNTDLAIKEIAFECGFTSVSYFNQKFKQLTGLSPKEFRRK